MLSVTVAEGGVEITISYESVTPPSVTVVMPPDSAIETDCATEASRVFDMKRASPPVAWKWPQAAAPARSTPMAKHASNRRR